MIFSAALFTFISKNKRNLCLCLSVYSLGVFNYLTTRVYISTESLGGWRFVGKTKKYIICWKMHYCTCTVVYTIDKSSSRRQSWIDSVDKRKYINASSFFCVCVLFFKVHCQHYYCYYSLSDDDDDCRLLLIVEAPCLIQSGRLA